MEISFEMRMLIYVAIISLLIWIPYILAELSTSGLAATLGYPEERKMPAWARRLKKAHYNLVENIAPFAVAVIAGDILNIHNGLTAACATIFLLARIAHPLAQVSHIWGTRTLSFAAGMAASLVYLVTILVTAL